MLPNGTAPVAGLEPVDQVNLILRLVREVRVERIQDNQSKPPAR